MANTKSTRRVAGIWENAGTAGMKGGAVRSGVADRRVFRYPQEIGFSRVQVFPDWPSELSLPVPPAPCPWPPPQPFPSPRPPPLDPLPAPQPPWPLPGRLPQGPVPSLFGMGSPPLHGQQPPIPYERRMLPMVYGKSPAYQCPSALGAERKVNWSAAAAATASRTVP